jgi:hypothetical protein
VFFYGHVFPTIAQLLIQNVPPDDPEFRDGNIAWAIYGCIIISTFSQTYTASQAYKSYINAGSLWEYLTVQHTIDTLSILFTYVYNILRIMLPIKTKLETDTMNPLLFKNQMPDGYA